MSQFLALVVASAIATQYFLISWPPVFVIERVGRRKLMMYAAVGQAVTMAVLAGVNAPRDSSGGGEDGGGGGAYAIVTIVFLFVFNSFFAFGWLGMGWLYPAEIVPLRIRAPANALSTSGELALLLLLLLLLLSSLCQK